MIEALFLSIVPSPYQRDLFRALANSSAVRPRICYMEKDCTGYPWPAFQLEPWEEILPVIRINKPFLRTAWNPRLPDFDAFDIVIVNAPFTTVTSQWVARTALTRRKWVFWGERLRKQTTGWRRLLQNVLVHPLNKASAIAAIGSVAQRDYQRRFPNVKTFNIPYFCDIGDLLKLNRPAHREETVYLFCGVMNRRKGVDLLLKAFDQLVQKNASARLILVGQEAELPSFLQDVSTAARARISFEGFHPPAALPKFFAEADVFILPSRYDGWGVVVNQALAAGLPIICSDAVGAGHDLIEDGQNGFRFQNGDAEKLRNCMQQFVDCPALTGLWGEKSRQKALDWTPDEGAAKWVNAIRDTLECSR